MSAPRRRWFDEAAGPIVRPYAVSRGRTRSQGESFDLTAVVIGGTASREDIVWLEPEHLRILGLCRRPVTVADLTSDVGLPLGVVRVLLGDLRERGLITVRRQEVRSPARDERILRTVLDVLHTL